MVIDLFGIDALCLTIKSDALEPDSGDFAVLVEDTNPCSAQRKAARIVINSGLCGRRGHVGEERGSCEPLMPRPTGENGPGVEE
jgi:hypothetical protein